MRIRRSVGAALSAAALFATAAGPTGRADDATRLRALHAKVMEAHRKGEVAMILADDSADNVVVSRGEVLRPTLEERRARLGPYLSSTRFEEYVDVIEPIVKVSSDGTLGWVIVQVRAKGTTTAPDGAKTPVEFVSGWIELYEKRDGTWWRVGNVSNFKP
ncbi:MAG TPA: hypothetical protein VIA29_03540 [Thermoanaerobaculia bacterium]